MEFAHESLLNEWPTLSCWLDENREEIVFLTEVGQAASLWDKRGRRTAELWTGEALAAVGRGRGRLPRFFGWCRSSSRTGKNAMLNCG